MFSSSMYTRCNPQVHIMVFSNRIQRCIMMHISSDPRQTLIEPPIPSEMIELPEPNSEYSDSELEDEGGQRKPEAPE